MKKYHILKAITLLSVLFLSACKSSVRPAPPAAQVGDTALFVTIKAPQGRSFAKGSDINVTLADTSQVGSRSIALAGDIIRMTQIDKEVRIRIPLDKDKVDRCSEDNVCGIFVQVTRGGNLVFSNSKPVPYETGQQDSVISLQAE